ncbi:MAG: diguanylate cyclase, partial [Verrucomicrobiota bacterium]
MQILLKESFDVLIVDLKMSEMSGLAFLQEARKIWPWLGVVVVSGFADHESIDEAEALGVRHILQKPIRLDVLRETVLKEAEESSGRDDFPESEPMDRIQNQLTMLRRLGEQAIESESFVEALRKLSHGLEQMVPSSLVGVLAIEDDDRIIMLSASEPVSQPFIENIKMEMINRYVGLSGQEVKLENFRIQFEGEVDESGEAPEQGSNFTVPVITGEEVHGLLTLGSTRKNAYVDTDMSFLYHAANQLSTVLVALSHMRQLAIRDPLTGLFNRRYLEQELDHIWNLAERHDGDLSVATLDIDNFKTINDTYGHQAGDQILREFSSILRETVRSTDIVSRFGGDEFIILCPQTPS